MTKWKYTYCNRQITSGGHASYHSARFDALAHCAPDEFTDPVSYEEEDMEYLPVFESVPLLLDPRVKVEVEYRQYVRVTYPPEMRDEMLKGLDAAGFVFGGYSGPVHNLMPDYDPEVRQQREVVYREFTP